VESLFLENNFNESKKYIETKIPAASEEQSIYYYTKLSHAYLRTGQFEKALNFAQKSNTGAKTISDKLLISETWRAMAFAFIRTSQLDSAMVYSEKMYRYGKESNNYDFSRAALMAMGNISMQQEKFTEAFQFYLDASSLSKKYNKSTNLKVDYYNISLALGRQKKIELSNEYLELALRIANNENDEVLLARIYGSLLDNYSRLNNNPKRIYYQDKANKIALKNNNLQLLAMGYSNMMQWSLNENNPTMALEYGKKSLTYLKKYPIQQLEVRVDSMMYAALKTIKRNDEALRFLESYTKKKKKMVSNETERNLNELIVKYDVENKNLKIKNQQNQLLIAKRERNIYMLILFILLLTITSVIILKNNRRIYKKILFNKDKYYDNLFYQTRSLLKNSRLTNPNEYCNLEDNLIHLPEEKSEFLFNKLIDTIEQEQLFLNPDLDQKTLIRILGTNKKYLYEAIKFHGESNFRGIINRLRINHAKKIIKEELLKGKTIHFVNLYINCGFNANSTFYRIFKSYTGLSPVEYSIELKKDLLKQKKQ
jgi:AraC-like DNA-binding protein